MVVGVSSAPATNGAAVWPSAPMTHSPSAAVSTSMAHRWRCAVSDSSPIGEDSTGNSLTGARRMLGRVVVAGTADGRQRYTSPDFTAPLHAATTNTLIASRHASSSHSKVSAGMRRGYLIISGMRT